MARSKPNIPTFAPYVSRSAIKYAAKTLSGAYIGQGPLVKKFEQNFAGVVGAKNPLAVNSGTSALYLALALIGLGPGDEVITTAQTFIATSHVILALGAKPVFADVKYLSGNLDPADIEHRITSRTKAIMPVHWAGYPCDLDEINKIARKHNIAVVEDAAQALGASYKDSPIGAISDYTCFSFQAIKQITTVDGGMLCLGSLKVYQQAKRRRWFGIDREKRKPTILGEPKWDVSEIGYKFHMNDVAASLGIKHLEEFPRIYGRLGKIANSYRRSLSKIPGITLFEDSPDKKSGHWVFCLHVQRRPDFIKMLKSKGVMASVVHLRIDSNSIFGGLRLDLPNLERFTKTMVCLPLYFKLKDSDLSYIIRCIKQGW
ncbi:unnamed protein product [marine sediment metagenome]|uniref:Aminotransferase class V domain-containing protein n=1 Tax=marine sediment metagenome TaxID=412755 RepID=X0SHF4_9ZZZZ